MKTTTAVRTPALAAVVVDPAVQRLEAALTKLLLDRKLPSQDVLQLLAIAREDGAVSAPEVQFLERVLRRQDDELTPVGEKILELGVKAAQGRVIKLDAVEEVLRKLLATGLQPDELEGVRRFGDDYGGQMEPLALQRLVGFTSEKTQAGFALLEKAMVAAAARGGIDLLETLDVVELAARDGAFTPDEAMFLDEAKDRYDDDMTNLVEESFDKVIDAEKGERISEDDVEDLFQAMGSNGLDRTDRNGMSELMTVYRQRFDRDALGVLRDVVDAARRDAPEVSQIRGLMGLAALNRIDPSEAINVFKEAREQRVTSAEIDYLYDAEREYSRDFKPLAKVLYPLMLRGEEGTLRLGDIEDLIGAVGPIPSSGDRRQLREFSSMYSSRMEPAARARLQAYLA